MTTTVGYDIGGAHLKIAAVEDGRLVLVRQIACPLWQGPERLDAAFDEAAGLTGAAAVHAVTMTAELTEIFESRQAGVVAILQKARERLRRRYPRLPGPQRLRFRRGGKRGSAFGGLG